MNTLKNTVKLIGNLGMNPEIVKMPSGDQLAKFSIATNETYKNKAGEYVQNTQWHNVQCWGKTAELCEKLLKKGAEVVLEGKLENNTYETKSGEKRTKTYVSLREFMLVNKGQSDK
jgi:single-strand DNA-binding protein